MFSVLIAVSESFMSTERSGKMMNEVHNVAQWKKNKDVDTKKVSLQDKMLALSISAKH